ncbi:unnamed protein product [Malus baccata var. baccata]
MWIYFYTHLIFKRLRDSLKAFLVPCRPQQIQYLTSLTSLEIYSIKGVESLPKWLGSPYIRCTTDDFVLRESDEFTKSPSYATPHQITIFPYLWMSSPSKGKMQKGQRHKLATRRKTIKMQFNKKKVSRIWYLGSSSFLLSSTKRASNGEEKRHWLHLLQFSRVLASRV